MYFGAAELCWIIQKGVSDVNTNLNSINMEDRIIGTTKNILWDAYAGLSYYNSQYYPDNHHCGGNNREVEPSSKVGAWGFYND